MKKRIITSVLILFFFITLNGQTTARPEKLKRSDCFFGIHFDLHASENIKDAGRSLSYEMVDTFLLRVKPDFIQIDCKGHPGISSYPTKVGFHVEGFLKDPLKLFREVTKKNNVALFMHFSGVWDNKVVQEHPDWAVIKANGERSTQKVSFFSPYLQQYMIPQLQELASVYRVDGAWVDGECWAVEPDFGEASVKRFIQQTGITEIPRKSSDKYWPEFIEYTRSLFRSHLKTYVDAIHASNPGFQITSNWAYSSLMPEKVTTDVDYLSGDVTPQNGVYRSAFEARCLAPQGKPWDLMAWGFSWNGSDMPMSIKSAVQLKQEAAEIMTMGGGVQFYFQQNRDLSIKPWLALMLEDIAGFCRERQYFCHKAVPVPQVALVYPSESYQWQAETPYSRPTGMLQGTLYALLDAQLPVEILMEHHLPGALSKYRMVVVPECESLTQSSMDEIKSFLHNGGRVLVIGSQTAAIFKNELGIRSSTLKPRGTTFISTAGRIGSVRSEILQVELERQALPVSYFYKGSDFRDRDETISASVNKVGTGLIGGIYFNAGSSYVENKTFVIRDFIDSVIKEMDPGFIVSVSGSNLVHMAINRLNGRLYLNLVNTAGEHTNQSAIGYDEIPPLHNLKISVESDSRPGYVKLQPGGRDLEFTYAKGKISFTVPELELHSIIEIY
ncbi:MAG: hypothetical protein GYA41_01280 [Bacteroidales bacterium]|nr:hypothetical protein [Bacteroidales bacterium]